MTAHKHQTEEKEPAHVDEFEENNRAAQSTAAPQSTVPFVDVNTIPDDVRKNLIGYDTMELDQLLLRIMSAPGAIYSVDKIVVDLWTKHNKKYDRMKVIVRLRTLIKQQLVFKQEHTRGIYGLTQEGRDLLAGAKSGGAA